MTAPFHLDWLGLGKSGGSPSNLPLAFVPRQNKRPACPAKGRLLLWSSDSWECQS